MPYDFKEKAAGGEREQKIIELTRYMMHKHYCENDVESVIAQMCDKILWIGTGENEYASGRETVAGIFRRFAGKVPKCIIEDEQYDVIEITPEMYLCSGRMWIRTDPSTGISLRVHQRITTAFQRKTDQFAAGAACQNHLSQLGRFGPGLLGSLPNLRAIPRPIEWTALGHRHTPGGVQRGISVHGGTGLWLSEPGTQELPLMLLRQSLQTAPRFLQQFPHGCHQGGLQLRPALLKVPFRQVGADIRLKLCPKVIHARSPSHTGKIS